MDEQYERDGVDEPWLEHVVTHGMRRIRAFIRRHGEHFAVEANSAARYERVLSVLRDIDPDLLIVSENRTTRSPIASGRRWKLTIRPAPEWIRTPGATPAEPASRNRPPLASSSTAYRTIIALFLTLAR